jgi:hypothetical protein
MKPLPSEPLTDQDRRIWRSVERRMIGKYAGWSWVRAVYAGGDVRDAELMLRLVRGGCSLCLGEVAHTAECVGWRWESICRRLRPPHEI